MEHARNFLCLLHDTSGCCYAPHTPEYIITLHHTHNLLFGLLRQDAL